MAECNGAFFLCISLMPFAPSAHTTMVILKVSLCAANSVISGFGFVYLRYF